MSDTPIVALGYFKSHKPTCVGTLGTPKHRMILNFSNEDVEEETTKVCDLSNPLFEGEEAGGVLECVKIIISTKVAQRKKIFSLLEQGKVYGVTPETLDGIKVLKAQEAAKKEEKTEKKGGK